MKQLQQYNSTLRKELKNVNNALSILIEHIQAYNMKKKTIATFEQVTPEEIILNRSKKSIQFMSPKQSKLSVLSPRDSMMSNMSGFAIPSPEKSLLLEEQHSINMKKHSRTL